MGIDFDKRLQRYDPYIPEARELFSDSDAVDFEVRLYSEFITTRLLATSM